jgi:hypothetical protein
VPPRCYRSYSYHYHSHDDGRRPASLERPLFAVNLDDRPAIIVRMRPRRPLPTFRTPRIVIVNAGLQQVAPVLQQDALPRN